MVGLSKRWIRQLVYLCITVATILVLLLFANKHNVIDLNAYLPSDVTPKFFQPPSDSYIIDLQVDWCYKYLESKCDLPKPNDGRLGDLKTGGGWVQIEKDLLLKSSLYKQQFLSYKKVKSQVLDGRVIADDKLSKRGNVFNKIFENFPKRNTVKKVADTRVVVDIAIENHQLDSKYANNKLKLPKYIIDQYNIGKSFNDDDHQELIKTSTHKPKPNPDLSENEKQKQQKQEKQQEETHEEDSKPEPVPENKENNKLKDQEDESKLMPDDKQVESEALLAQIENEKAGSNAEAKANALLQAENKENPDDTIQPDKEAEALKQAEKELHDSKEKEKLLANSQNEKEKEAEALKQAEKDQHDVKEKGTQISNNPNEKRAISRHDLKMTIYIPSEAQIINDGWVKSTHGIWLKYGKASDEAVTAIDVLYGDDCVDPRPNWKLIKDGPIHVSAASDKKPYITFRKGPRLDYAKFDKKLKFNKEGLFKILQVADLHFSTGFGKCRDPSPSQTKKGCQADPRTLKFLNQVLDLENPDMVVLTGDQIFGDAAPDSETALFKALNPFVSRKIPFAVTLGNHDDEGSLNRHEIMDLSSQIPYSKAIIGPETVDGVGNYMLTVESKKNNRPGLALYFLDTHKHSPNPKAYPGYDWIKDSQKRYLAEEFEVLKSKVLKYTDKFLSMAFFHIPLPEYRNTGQTMVGAYREGVTAPLKNSGIRDLLSNMDVKVVSVGHDHCNEYCLRDTPEGQEPDAHDSKNLWLCYGGGAGEGGYGGYDNFIRKLRIFEINEQDGRISSWKRAENEPLKAFDLQHLVQDGIAK